MKITVRKNFKWDSKRCVVSFRFGFAFFGRAVADDLSCHSPTVWLLVHGSTHIARSGFYEWSPVYVQVVTEEFMHKIHTLLCQGCQVPLSTLWDCGEVWYPQLYVHEAILPSCKAWNFLLSSSSDTVCAFENDLSAAQKCWTLHYNKIWILKFQWSLTCLAAYRFMPETYFTGRNGVGS